MSPSPQPSLSASPHLRVSASVVVTGCRGQLGAELCRQFGPEAVGVDLPEFDLRDGDRIRSTLEAIRPRVVVNTAAFTLVDRAETEPELCRLVNVEGVARLVEACRDLDCALVQMSTDYVFGGDASRRTPYREADEPAPQGVYAASKWESERVAAQWQKHLVVRTSGLYGPPAERSAGNFVDAILRAAAAGKPLRVVNDQRCAPTYTPHLARAIRFLVGVGASGIYHVTSAGDATWHEFALEIVQRAGFQIPVQAITTAEWGAAVPRPAYSVLDCSKYRSLPDAAPMPAWAHTLAEYLRASSGAASQPPDC